MLRFALCGKVCRRHAILSTALDCTKQCRCKLRGTSFVVFFVQSKCDMSEIKWVGHQGHKRINDQDSIWPNRPNILSKQIPSHSIEFKQAFSTSEVINCTWASSLLLQNTRGITPKGFPSFPSLSEVCVVGMRVPYGEANGEKDDVHS